MFITTRISQLRATVDPHDCQNRGHLTCPAARRARRDAAADYDLKLHDKITQNMKLRLANWEAPQITRGLERGRLRATPLARQRRAGQPGLAETTAWGRR